MLKIMASFLISLIALASYAGDCGDVNSDNKLNLLDISYMISNLYKGGPEPICGTMFTVFCGDITGDSKFNLLDVSCVINHLYRGGPGPLCGTIADIDGNIYKTVRIGGQIWTTENLKVTHYNNGDSIPLIANEADWAALTAGAQCSGGNYYNQYSIIMVLGRYYNWYAVNDDRRIAPIGWHVPSDAEWKQMEIYLGMDPIIADNIDGRGTIGNKLKATGYGVWGWSCAGATNSSGFTALPYGVRNYDGYCYYTTNSAFFWTSSEFDSGSAWGRGLGCYYSTIGRNNYSNKDGCAVRCVRDKMPSVTTAAVTEVTFTTAQCGGTVVFENDASVTEKGVCWSTNPFPTIVDNRTTDGAGLGSFVSSVTGLSSATTYYIRSYATGSAGTGYGITMIFMTSPKPPELITTNVSGMTETTAECGGTITSDGGSNIIDKGICWSTGPEPTTIDNIISGGSGMNNFSCQISGLTSGTTYFVRAYAINSTGTGYGAIKRFRTVSETGTMTDIDGTIYKTVKIGDQWWMAENLKVTHYRNGDAIPNVTNDSDWLNLTSGAYCEYDNDIGNAAIYGRLYNWFSISDGRNIAPEGWHVPTDDEWKQLEIYLGMSPVTVDSTFFRGTNEGGKLKDTGDIYWQDPNIGANNESGFTALAGEYRFDNGQYCVERCNASFWCFTEFNTVASRSRFLSCIDARIARINSNKQFGYSIRCIKD